MSQMDPTGIDTAGDELLADSMGGQISYEEATGLSNGELGIAEPTQRADMAHEAMPEAPAAPKAPSLPIPKVPLPPFPVIRKAVSGRYAGMLGQFTVELRVDLDRARSMKRISGDFYQTIGKTQSYYGSFIVDAPAVTVSPLEIVARGKGRFTFAAGAPVVQVTIPRVLIVQPQAPASLQFLTVTNIPGANYHCAFESV